MAVRFVVFCIFFALGLGRVLDVSAAPPGESVQAGEIEIEEIKKEQWDPKKQAQERLQTWFTEMRRYSESGGTGEVAPLSDEGISYLSTLYLYCITQFGPCPYILDTLLESDLRDARIKGETKCSTLSKFWKTWLASDLESRARYLLSIGAGTAIAEFNLRERPKYLQCKQTVAGLIADPAATKARYGPQGTTTAAISKTIKLFGEVRTKELDIHKAVGLSH